MEFGGYATLFSRLLAEAQIVGSDLAVTNAATGNRESIFGGGSGRWINKVSADLTDYSPGTTKAGDPDFNISTNSAQIIQDSDDRGYLSPQLGSTSGQTYTVSFTITENTFALDVGAFQDEKTGGTTQTVAAGYTGEFEFTWVSAFSGASGLRVGPGITGAQAGQMTITDLRIVNSPSAAPAFPVGSGSGYVMPDSLTVNNIPLYSSMIGATNLVSTVLSSWSQVNCTYSGVTFSENVGGAEKYNTISASKAASSLSYTFTARVKDESSGSRNFALACTDATTGGLGAIFNLGTGAYVQQLSIGSTTGWSLDSYSIDSADDGWYLVSITVTSNTATTLASVSYSLDGTDRVYTGDGRDTYSLRDMRTTQTTYPVAAFPDGSAAGATYGADLISCTPTWGSEGTIITFEKLYADTTITNFSRVFSAKTDTWHGESVANDIAFTAETVVLTPYSLNRVDGNTHILSLDWNGVNVGHRVDDDSRTETANTGTPSSTLYLGSRGHIGDLHWHGMVGALIFDRALTDAEYETLRAGLLTRISGVTYQ